MGKNLSDNKLKFVYKFQLIENSREEFLFFFPLE